MSQRKRSYRSPVVLTLALVVPACAGSASDGGAPDGSGGSADGAGGSQDGVGGVGTGGVVGTGGSAAGAGGRHDLPTCDFSFDAGYGTCTSEEPCQVTMDCTSGLTRSYQFSCEDGYWMMEAAACENEAEFCQEPGAGSTFCADESWMYMGMGGNPPAPCPDEAPALDSSCRSGSGFGADRSACGYFCSYNPVWTVVGCVAPEGEGGEIGSEGTWQSDGACSFGGFGGQGGAGD